MGIRTWFAGTAGFRFDPVRQELVIDGRRRALRPKAASLLSVLLAARGQLVTKRDLVRRVWRTEHVQDQTLFQTVSELRRCLAPMDAIKTHPNLGYQWVGPRSGYGRQRRAVAAAVATLVVAIGAAWQTAFVAEDGPEARADAEWIGLSPALRAFSLGLEHLHAGRADDARHYFELALTENPGFVEARLMLSEALLAQGHASAARDAAHSVVSASAATGDDYSLVTALGLLSRTDETLGDAAGALTWALSAAERATALGFACAAADMQARVDTLAGVPADASTPVAAPESADAPADEAPVLLSRAAPVAGSAARSEPPAYCTDLAPGEVDTSALTDPFDHVAWSDSLVCGIAASARILRV